MTLPNLDPILNGNPADAILVDNNFDKLASYVDSDLINKDGSVAMEQPLLLSAISPSNPLHAVRLADLGGGGGLGIPAGTVMDYAGDGAPAGQWLLCDGSLYDGAPTGDYAALFAVIGTTYNTGGEGATQFRVPNLIERGTIGTGGTYALGQKNGSPDRGLNEHTHGFTDATYSFSGSALPIHYHATNSYPSSSRVTIRAGDSSTVHPGVDITSGSSGGKTADRSAGTPAGSVNLSASGSVASTGFGDGDQSNYHPVMTLNKIIRY